MRIAWLAIFVTIATPPAALAAQRFAVFAGNDVGGFGTPDLGYAAQDARGMRATLTQLGDFPPDHVELLENRTAADVRSALSRIERRVKAVRATGEYVLLLFYYSGHADSDGLRIAGDLLPYDEIRRFLADSEASAKIAIVDACSSGSLTQVKSPRPVGAFDLHSTLQDTATGLAFIASTAMGESALESSSLQGSYFTAHFQAALRGAGDYDGDGKVSLTEAFRYARTQTTAETSRSHENAQHPTYDMRMSGRGELVLTVLNRAEASLILPRAPGATWTILSRHAVVSEIPGSDGPVNMAFAPGAYVVERRDARSLLTTEVELHAGTQPLPPMREVGFLVYRDKGVRLAPRVGAGVDVSSGVRPGTFGMPVGILTADFPLRPVRLQVSVEVGGESTVDGGLPFLFVTAGAQAAVLVSLLRARWGELEVGGEAGYAWDLQRVPLGPTFGSGDGWLGAVAQMLFPLGPIAIGPRISGRAHLLRAQLPPDEGGGSGWTVSPTADLGLVFVMPL